MTIERAHTVHHVSPIQAIEPKSSLYINEMGWDIVPLGGRIPGGLSLRTIVARCAWKIENTGRHNGSEYLQDWSDNLRIADLMNRAMNASESFFLNETLHALV